MALLDQTTPVLPALEKRLRSRSLRILFVKEQLAWPRSSGHDVHSFHMILALAQQGHELSLITLVPPSADAIRGLPLSQVRSMQERSSEGNGSPSIRLTRLQERFRSYWGIEPTRIAAVGRAAEICRADAVVAVGLNVLPYFGAVSGPLCIWYAADEWAWHHLSQVRPFRTGTWGEMRQAAVKGVYERAYRPLLDRVWVVSRGDRNAMRLVAGVPDIDLIPNGVDGEHYRPIEAAEGEQSCVFWGRLDFGPNVQALDWFCRKVWPLVQRERPSARFTIYGFNPGPAAAAWSRLPGVAVIADLPDLRPEIARHQVVVLPFVSGGGIKNKLLEAAAMGKAVVCTPRTCAGLQPSDQLPLCTARTPAQWLGTLRGLWSNAASRQRLGADAREWVLAHHTWPAAARLAVAGVEQSLKARKVAAAGGR